MFGVEIFWILLLSIFILYLLIVFVNRTWDLKIHITDLVRELAIMNSKQRILEGEIAFVIPVYNVGEEIKTVLQDLMKQGFEKLVVINDGSTDDTLNSLKILEDTNRDLILLHHFRNRGEGAALQTGFEYLRRYGNVDYVVTYNSYGFHDVHDIPLFLDTFKKDEKLDIVLGSRFLDGANTNASFAKRTLLKLGVFFTWFTTGTHFTDAHNGYRMMKLKALDKISLTMDGNSYASEILNIIAKKKLSFKEVPVSIMYNSKGKEKSYGVLSAIEIVFKVLWEKIFR